jgi:hypothetical protein
VYNKDRGLQWTPSGSFAPNIRSDCRYMVRTSFSFHVFKTALACELITLNKMQQLVTANLYTCVNLHGTGHIHSALETTTTEEIIMVYEEVIPLAHTLTTNVFRNYTIQKLLEHRPQFYELKIICNFIGHVVPLNLHLYA